MENTEPTSGAQLTGWWCITFEPCDACGQPLSMRGGQIVGIPTATHVTVSLIDWLTGDMSDKQVQVPIDSLGVPDAYLYRTAAALANHYVTTIGPAMDRHGQACDG